MHPITSRLVAIASIGPLLMLGASLNFAVLDILVKLLGPSFRVWDIAFYRFFASLLILIALVGRHRNPFKGQSPKLMAVNGIISSLGFVALATSLRHINLSTTMVLFYSFPAFAALFSTLIFREKISKGELLCVFVALAGVMVLVEFQLGGSFFGQMMGLLAGLAIGLTVAITSKLREKDGSVVIYLYYCLVGTVVALPPFIAHPQVPKTTGEVTILVGIILSSLFAMLLMNKGLRYCRSWEGGLILTNELVFTAIFGIAFLHEPFTWRFICGGLLILGSVVALNLGIVQKPSHPPIATFDR